MVVRSARHDDCCAFNRGPVWLSSNNLKHSIRRSAMKAVNRWMAFVS